jgi:hypothetical protein
MVRQRISLISLQMDTIERLYLKWKLEADKNFQWVYSWEKVGAQSEEFEDSRSKWQNTLTYSLNQHLLVAI